MKVKGQHEILLHLKVFIVSHNEKIDDDSIV